MGQWVPWLVHSEVLHYGYAVIMLVGLWVLLPGFAGRSRAWWLAALVIQFWHHIEHALLQGQVISGRNPFGSPVPTSIVQLWIHAAVERGPGLRRRDPRGSPAVAQRPRSSAGRPMPDGRQPAPGGWSRIQLVVEDLPAEVDRLRAAGLRFRNDIVTGPGGSQIPAR